MYYKPSYVPQNGAANILVRHLAEQLGLKLNKKYEIVLASFIAIAKKVNGQAFDWWPGNETINFKSWSLFPNISNQSVRKVYSLLKQNDYIIVSKDFPNYNSDRIGFGKPNWIKAKRLPKYFLGEAKFVESNLPMVFVNKPEKFEDTWLEKSLYLASPKFGLKESRQRLNRDYTKAYATVLEMNDFWRQHPLYDPIKDEFYSSGTRIFYNGSINSGGGWYGGWTSSNPDQRFNFKVDDKPIVHIKVNAMIVALLSILTGKPINMIGTFEDIYSAVVFQLAGVSNAREKVKKVIMELIGAGNPCIEAPSKDNDILNCTEEFIQIRDLCLQAYPALKFLDKERLNYSNDLSYHEANIVTQTVLSLKNLGIVAYPFKSSLIVGLGHEFEAVETIKRIFKDYAVSFQEQNKLTEIDLDIALTVEFSSTKKFKIQGTSR